MTATLTPRERELAIHAFDPTLQHDDHCWVVFAGTQRWIIGKRGDLLATTCEDGLVTINLSAVDWHAYGFVAREMLREAFPDSSLTRAGAEAALEPGESLDLEDFPR
jgi:hypothetical protein